MGVIWVDNWVDKEAKEVGYVQGAARLGAMKCGLGPAQVNANREGNIFEDPAQTEAGSGSLNGSSGLATGPVRGVSFRAKEVLCG